jgi:peptide-methionine (S)-S-oxide reductase
MTETIVLGGGCFWCTEAVFDRVRGVVDVESGYCNGQTPNPSYEQVCTGRTGHAEVVRLVFDAEAISLREILEIFFAVHDPTTLNRQGNDVGTQYRSGIYYVNDAQKWVAEDAIREIGYGVVTEVKPLAHYSKAEDYHQDYFLNHPNEGYCAFVIRPKVGKFQNTFAKYLKQ